MGLLVVVCALAGALAGIAGSAAAPSKAKSAAASAAKSKSAGTAGKKRGMLGLRHGPLGPGRRGMAVWGPPVHGEMVVPNANGDGFDKVITDSGKLKSIDAGTLTVTEGTDKATFDEPTIDVGSDATVVRNHEKATLGDLKAGDFVHIVRGPKGNFVMAEDATFRAQERKDRGRFGHFHGPPPGGP
jgi:hypothetical protein